MIKFIKGNLLDAQVDALVNTVNEVGVMGKGIALMFSEAFPKNTAAYVEASKRKDVRIGKMFVTENEELAYPRWIINFPTKQHWRNPSKVEWISEGLDDLVRVIEQYHINSIALPPLGCGNGGLDWGVVRTMIVERLGQLRGVDIQVYEPIAQYQNVPKPTGVAKLTPARALMAELVRRYSILGFDCTILEVQKLAWFLQRGLLVHKLDDPTKLQFEPNKYGPYSEKLRHLLNGLDGSYLHSEKRLGDAGPLDIVTFDDQRRDEVRAYLADAKIKKYSAALDWTAEMIDGFESPFGMELLATIDWLLTESKIEPTVAALKQALLSWPGGTTAGQRKYRLFNEKVLAIALERLRNPPSLHEAQLAMSI
jgi:O-acetyl-ADP-ribose deacetylase (regulator of RNase III)